MPIRKLMQLSNNTIKHDQVGPLPNLIIYFEIIRFIILLPTISVSLVIIFIRILLYITFKFVFCQVYDSNKNKPTKTMRKMNSYEKEIKNPLALIQCYTTSLLPWIK